jgi:branched-chain amino acid transport system substrate-binding protein
MRPMTHVLPAFAVILTFLFTSWAAAAQTVKIGMLGTYSGPFAAYGEQMDRGLKLYMKLHQDRLPAGVTVEVISRDDDGPLPDKAKALAQELIVRDHVQFLTGVTWTPNALALAPLVTEAKLPMVLLNAATSIVTTKSPYIVRFSFTEWQSSYTLGRWAAGTSKRAMTLVSDFAPGHDAEEAFTKSFTAAGGQIVRSVRMPLQTIDPAPFVQRVADVRPEVLFVFVPAGQTSLRIMKSYDDLGLRKSGVKLIGSGVITADEELQNMGDVALGTVTAYHYSPAGDRPANRAFNAAFAKEYGDKVVPTLMTIAAWDAMDAIYTAIVEQKGRLDPDRTMKILSHYKGDSPRGPIAIDPATRDIVQNVYIREVRRVGGQLGNVEIETIPNVKDPWKELQSK